MKVENMSSSISVSDQISVEDIKKLADGGVKILVCNRPDHEGQDQPEFAILKDKALTLGMETYYMPFSPGELTEEQIKDFAVLLDTRQKLHAFCRSGNRSKTLYNAAHEWQTTHPANDAMAPAEKPRISNVIDTAQYDVVVIGAGSAGIATASSLLKRNKNMRVVLVDPSPVHYYQPGWSMVGGGAFEQKATQRDMKDVIPRRCEWVQASVKNIVADENHVLLNNDMKIYYKQLVVAPGLRIDWSAIEGLEETLGKNGVTSNYRYDLAPYTWQLVNEFKGGKAIFTQPPMPIKCAGAPQKAMYLSCSAWKRNGVLNKADVHFCNAGGVLFGVKEYVPALMEYVDDYGIKLDFQRTLVKVNGALKTAWFKDAEGKLHETVFDFLHVVPPQVAPDFVQESGLADEKGWLDVDKHTLRSTKYSNVWGVGDIVNAPNAKTMAAARKQAPVVAQNIFNTIEDKDDRVNYDGYGSCPLMVEHGKIVLAEFRYGGKLSPTFPSWINNGTKATKLAWFLKQKMLPVIYWHGMLKGREFLTDTEQTDD